MKKLLLIVVSLIVLSMAVWTASASDEARQLTLQERIMSHPDAVQMGDGWFRIVIKENLSNTEYDWRFDVRVIEVYRIGLNIIHREEQNSGNHPDSNWVIEYTFIDKLIDGTLEYFDKDRFVSVKNGEGWFRIPPTWPDKFIYPDLFSEEEALELYKKELEWWDNKL